MQELLKRIQVKKLQVKHALEQYRIMREMFNKDYEKEINDLLDQLSALSKMEKELEKRNRK